MSLTTKKVVRLGETFQVKNTTTEFDGSVLEPDSHSIQLYKADGTVEGAAKTSPSGSAGVYKQTFKIPTDGVPGEWYVDWTFTYSTEDTPRKIKFKVVA
ncbi:hypothetical protein ES707_12219 [subsurface metagenome]